VAVLDVSLLKVTQPPWVTDGDVNDRTTSPVPESAEIVRGRQLAAEAWSASGATATHVLARPTPMRMVTIALEGIFRYFTPAGCPDFGLLSLLGSTQCHFHAMSRTPAPTMAVLRSRSLSPPSGPS
jgi:hypothetical protein